MSAHKPWVTASDAEKRYTRSDSSLFKAFPSDVSFAGDCRRHKFDLELATAAAGYSRGPRYSEATKERIADVLRSGDNVHYHGSKEANRRDRHAADAVLRSAYYGEPVTVKAHAAAHIREGAEFLASRKADLPGGFVKSAAEMYSGVRDASGRKVVDGRMFNTGRPKGSSSSRK